MHKIYFVPQVHATTFFDYQGAVEALAYREHFLREDNAARVAALPFCFPSAERKLWTFSHGLGLANAHQHKGVFVIPFYQGKYTVAQVLDIGPWWTTGGDDPYWRNDTRPLAEQRFRDGGSLYSPQQQKNIKVVSPAGVDFTPQVWVDLGFDRTQAFASKISARLDIAVVERW